MRPRSVAESRPSASSVDLTTETGLRAKYIAEYARYVNPNCSQAFAPMVGAGADARWIDRWTCASAAGRPRERVSGPPSVGSALLIVCVMG